MSKTKWYAKPIVIASEAWQSRRMARLKAWKSVSILIALALVLSLSLVPAVPVGAVGETFDLDGKTFESDYGPDRGYVAYIQPYDATNLYHSLPGQAIEQYGDPGDAPLGPWDQGDWFKFEYGKPFGGGERQAWAGQNYVVTYWWGCAGGYFPRNGPGGDIYIYQPEDGVRPMGILYQGEWRMFDAGTNGLSDVRGDDFWWDLSDAGVAEGDTIEALAWWSNALGWPGLLIEKLIDKGPPKVKEQYPGPDALDMNGDGSTEPLTFVGGGNPSSWHDPFYMGIKYGTPVVCPSQVWVDDGYSMGGDNDGHTWCYDAFDKIQDGIDAVAGSTVHVAAGIYYPTSTIVIDKDNLTLLGPQANVDPRSSYGSSRTPGSATEAVIDGSPNNLGMIIEVDAESVVINGLEVKSGTEDMIKQDSTHSGTTVKYCIIHDGLGDEGVQLKKCTDGVLEYNYVFEIADKGDGLNIADNSSYGIIRHNEVCGIHGENAAIYIYGAEHMEIIGNLVRDSGIGGNDGIKVGSKDGSDADKQDVLIKDNVIHDITQDGISVYMSGVTVEGNEIYNCGSENGIIHVAFAVTDITIRGNTVRDNTLSTSKFADAAGILIRDTVDVANVTVEFNNIYNNSPYGVTNHAAATLNATYNWWGSVDGPEDTDSGTNECSVDLTTTPPTFNCLGWTVAELLNAVAENTTTLGDKVSDNVDYCPWLEVPYRPTTPMASFVIDHAKLDFKRKPNDDKVDVKGTLALDLDNGDGVVISEDVTVTVGTLSQTINMEQKGKEGEKWEYKRPKDDGGIIKHMTINWKNGKFDFSMDKVDLSGLTNPDEVTISIQIGDDLGEATISMTETKHWDYKAP